MSDSERDNRDFLRAQAAQAPQPTGITSATVRRARLKRAGFLSAAAVDQLWRRWLAGHLIELLPHSP